LSAGSACFDDHVHRLRHVVAHALDVSFGAHRLLVALIVGGPDHKRAASGTFSNDLVDGNRYSLDVIFR